VVSERAAAKEIRISTTDAERDAVLTIALHASFADGTKDEREREQVKRIAESLAPGGGADLAALYQDVLLGRRTVEAAAAALASPTLRQLAYEMAVCVCDADGVHGEPEKAFLARLQRTLALDASAATAFNEQAATIAAAAAPPTPRADAPEPGTAAPAEAAALDDAIVKASILNGALELLPESLATMAILPLQMRLGTGSGAPTGTSSTPVT
jgi:tellurite resistance protein